MNANSTIGRDPNERDTLKDDIDTLLENSATITDTPSTFSSHQILLSSVLEQQVSFQSEIKITAFLPFYTSFKIYKQKNGIHHLSNLMTEPVSCYYTENLPACKKDLIVFLGLSDFDLAQAILSYHNNSDEVISFKEILHSSAMSSRSNFDQDKTEVYIQAFSTLLRNETKFEAILKKLLTASFLEFNLYFWALFLVISNRNHSMMLNLSCASSFL